MDSSKIKKSLVYPLVFLILFSLPGCSRQEKGISEEMPDTEANETREESESQMPDFKTDKDKIASEKTASENIAIPDPNEEGLPERIEMDISTGYTREMGEEVPVEDVNDANQIVLDAVGFTVQNAELFEDYEAAGIAMDAVVSDCEYSDEQGEKLKDEIKVLIVDMMIENYRAVPERNITEFDLVSLESEMELSDKLTNARFVLGLHPTYFFPPGKSDREYFHYYVPVGQSKNVRVGWYLDPEDFDFSNLYLVFNRWSEDGPRYVKLTLKDE